jgi:excisionase family DNA binding protein
MHRSLQFGMRENPASDRRHGSRLAGSSSSSETAKAVEVVQEQGTASHSKGGDVSLFELPLADANDAAVRKERGSTHFLTVEEVAVRLGVSRNWVYTHASELGVFRLGKYLRFSWTRVLERLGQ